MLTVFIHAMPQFRQLNNFLDFFGIWCPRPERCDLQGTKALVDAAKAKGRSLFFVVCCLESKDWRDYLQ